MQLNITDCVYLCECVDSFGLLFKITFLYAYAYALIPVFNA